MTWASEVCWGPPCSSRSEAALASPASSCPSDLLVVAFQAWKASFSCSNDGSLVVRLSSLARICLRLAAGFVIDRSIRSTSGASCRADPPTTGCKSRIMDCCPAQRACRGAAASTAAEAQLGVQEAAFMPRPGPLRTGPAPSQLAHGIPLFCSCTHTGTRPRLDTTTRHRGPPPYPIIPSSGKQQQRKSVPLQPWSSSAPLPASSCR